ncbi:helix-turn-helix domain-containing protein [Fusobacterium sp. PH5-44]|uniref:helix-turn-helix domain-containing protein n=1 Tax=unclassified Fusobacterium TaxID=2648384 RepID=UPI003D199CF8
MKAKESNDYLERKRKGEKLKFRRIEGNYSIYRVSNILSIKISDLKAYESGLKDIPKEVYEQLIKFYIKEYEEVYLLLSKTLSKKLKKSRIDARYTLIEAANHVGISPANLSSCEKFATKRIRKEVFSRLEELYDTALFDDDEEELSNFNSNINNEKKVELPKFNRNKICEIITKKDNETEDKKQITINHPTDSEIKEIKENEEKVKISHKKNKTYQIFDRAKEEVDEKEKDIMVITDENLSQMLRMIREKRRFTITRAANYIGVSCCTLGNYEKNKIKTISPSRLKKLADLYEDDELKKYLHKNNKFLKDKEICKIDEKIRNELISLRKNVGCSFKKIADMVQMTPSGILDYEIGKIKTISMGRLKKLRKAYEEIAKELKEKSKSKTAEQKLGVKLKVSRNKIGLTQAEVSEQLGISKSLLTNYERGIIKRVPIEILERLSEIYQDDTIKNFVLSGEYLKSGGKPNLAHSRKQGEELKEKRYRLGYTLKEIEKLVGTSAKTIAYYENGKSKKIPVELLEKLEKLYSESSKKIKFK